MEPIISKLQEGVKYPRFERDATKTINDLVDHITKERGVYSSSIEPNPNEHKVWFNTDTNTLMIYNNHVWRDFSGSGSSSGWSVENVLVYIDDNDNYVIDNIKDKTFYILDLNVDYVSYIEIPNLSDDVEFYIFISSMPEKLYFPNSNIITNYDTIVRHTTGNNIVGMSVLAHKIGITVEFSIINDKTDASNKNYVYNTKAESALLPFIGEDNNMHYITKNAIVNENNLNQIEALLPSNVQHKGYINGTFCVNGPIQIVYEPFHLPIDDILSKNTIVVFKGFEITHSPIKLLTIRSSDNYDRTDHLTFTLPNIAIFDKFALDYKYQEISTFYPPFVDGDYSAIVIKDNWTIRSFNGLDKDDICSFDIILDDFLTSHEYKLFNEGNKDIVYLSNVIINNHSNENDIENVLYTLCSDMVKYKPNPYSTSDISDVYDEICTIIFTTTCKTNMIFIPSIRDDYYYHYDTPLYIILPYKVTNDFSIKIDDYLSESGNIIIITIPDNYDIINNCINYKWSEGKPISEIDNIHINTTLKIESKYDKKGLLNEVYNYEYNGEKLKARFNRIDTPLIG